MSENAAHYGRPIRILAAREYAGDVVKWIWGGKYSGKPRNGFEDAIEAVEEFAVFKRELADRTLVVPVPGRIGGKTYELSPRLASAVASKIDLPLAVVLERTREAPPMRRMGPEKRRANVAGLYRVAHPAKVKGQRVLVVDDVSTTGATLQEIGHVLLAAGAADVMGLVLAKVKKKRKGKAPVAKKKKARKKAPKKAPKAKAPGDIAELRTYRLTIAEPAGGHRGRRMVRALNKYKGVMASWRAGWAKDEVQVDVYARSEEEAQEIVTGALSMVPKRRRRRR